MNLRVLRRNLKVYNIVLIILFAISILGNTKVLANESNISNILGVSVDKELIDRNYSKGEKINPTYIVIHDTDNRNTGADAIANRNYFANHKDAKASAHYVVDEDSVVQALEENWKGWHIGDGNNSKINNDNTIAIELCVNKDNDFDKTLELGINLTKQLMSKYNIPPENVVRHHDCSGKICPKMMMEDRPELWSYFQSQIGLEKTDKKPDYNIEQMNKWGKVINVKSMINLRKGPSINTDIIGKMNNEEDILVNYIENGWANVTTPSGVTGFIKNDYIDINYSNDESKVEDLKEEKYEEVTYRKGKVVGVNSVLQVRKGKGTNCLVIGKLKANTEVKILGESDGWYNILFLNNNKEKQGYVSSKYIKVQ
ncbi:N-acetylmuramoyl-L-alanine amidase [Clostridium tarantellae]|uniref:N-acetylmuramoyl-L-alanine amidase n=1 Tax=Clostridium tarantellae TaxID=39493 RepID=A0A6I1MT17_9CLOT|nr:N-acetylmuramoyl-L-alanine amidase [Clostridium tarantellae]MPQ43379.1 SH3 domain-containing protein [Clostridium tarantellae]